MVKVRVKTSKPYDVLIGSGILKNAHEYIAEITSSKRLAVITDDIVNSLYADTLIGVLEGAGFDICKYVFPNGEKSKNTVTYVNILNFLAENHLTRIDTVIALGGGVVGDMAGFAAATYLRGIRYVQIPTTLLSAVDSSVGGKCAVDLAAGKNLVGAFHQPSLVICDTDTLDTLKPEILSDGCGEVLKYGVLSTPELLVHLSEKGADFDREEVISTCVKLKADIVAEDEFDKGKRALLNLGHTTAHAIEKLSDFSVSHGSAVATGLAIIARICAAAGMCDEDTARDVEAAVKKLGHSLNTVYTAKQMCDIILSDKKRRGSVIDFVCIRSVGDCFVKAVSVEDTEAFVSMGI